MKFSVCCVLWWAQFAIHPVQSFPLTLTDRRISRCLWTQDFTRHAVPGTEGGFSGNQKNKITKTSARHHCDFLIVTSSNTLERFTRNTTESFECTEHAVGTNNVLDSVVETGLPVGYELRLFIRILGLTGCNRLKLYQKISVYETKIARVFYTSFRYKRIYTK